MSAFLPPHALERGGERLGLSKPALQKMADLALRDGIRHREARGSFGRYLDRLFLVERRANNMRVYGEHIFLFSGERLITIFHLPPKYKKIVKKIKEVRNG